MEKEYKYFSPSFSRRLYINKVKSWSEETCHNLIRLILRPNHRSANHWIEEMTPWIYRTVVLKIESKNKPVQYIFHEFADISNRKFEWHKGLIESWVSQVKLEKYGKYLDLSIEDVVEKLNHFKTLLLNCPESIGYKDVSRLIKDWSLS